MDMCVLCLSLVHSLLLLSLVGLELDVKLLRTNVFIFRRATHRY